MPIVTITPKYLNNTVYRQYAARLSDVLNGNAIHGYLGKLADFRNSGVARQSFIEKVHIRVPGEKPWGKSIRQEVRVSDNFLVFCKHCMYDDYYQVIAIITPDAHAKSDAMIPILAGMAETYFHSLSFKELMELESF
ncbi:MAG: type II toxin-antitoxin system YafO family toxin [Providencia heimbachae]|nr:type II toxin-antitoxin system YafO family toxin [Providencia heimbachae]